MNKYQFVITGEVVARDPDEADEIRGQLYEYLEGILEGWINGRTTITINDLPEAASLRELEAAGVLH